MKSDWSGAFESDATGVVTVENLTSTDLHSIELILHRVPGFVLKLEGDRSIGEIAIVLTSDQHLSDLHAEHLDDPSPTDIMTFPLSTSPGNVSGDIVISVDRARSRNEESWSLDDELLFIAIHGMLHLCGWDDLEPASRERMHARQHEILQVLKSGA